MSEAEGHVLKQRMLAGKRAKAQRGELGMQLPMGFPQFWSNNDNPFIIALIESSLLSKVSAI